MVKAIVTTERKCREESVALAQELSARLQIDYVERHKESVGKLMEKYAVEAVLVAYPQELKLNSSAGEMFFHPNMSQLRVKNLRKGERDHMSEAMGLQEGMSVLDCTLGFGADAIVAGGKWPCSWSRKQSLDCSGYWSWLAAFSAGKLSPLRGYAPYRGG